jgi:hypothetical protein
LDLEVSIVVVIIVVVVVVLKLFTRIHIAVSTAKTASELVNGDDNDSRAEQHLHQEQTRTDNRHGW